MKRRKEVLEPRAKSARIKQKSANGEDEGGDSERRYSELARKSAEELRELNEKYLEALATVSEQTNRAKEMMEENGGLREELEETRNILQRLDGEMTDLKGSNEEWKRKWEESEKEREGIEEIKKKLNGLQFSLKESHDKLEEERKIKKQIEGERDFFADLCKSRRLEREGRENRALAVDGGDSKSGIIRFEINNVSTLNDFGVKSHVVEVGGVPWRLEARRTTHRKSLRLRLSSVHYQSSAFRIEIDAEFRFPSKHSSSNVSGMGSAVFNGKSSRSSSIAARWDGFFDEKMMGLIKDDKVLVECHFSITNMRGVRIWPRIDFTDPNEPRHDVKLVIEGEKVYVNKANLAFHSPVFNVMFYGDFVEKNKEEIELKDVDREEFLEMLKILPPSCKNILPGKDRDEVTSSQALEYLLKLADRFQIQWVTDRVEDYLIDLPCRIPCIEKLRIADQYRLYALKMHFFDRFDYGETNCGEIAESPIYRILSEEIKEELNVLFPLIGERAEMLARSSSETNSLAPEAVCSAP